MDRAVRRGPRWRRTRANAATGRCARDGFTPVSDYSAGDVNTSSRGEAVIYLAWAYPEFSLGAKLPYLHADGQAIGRKFTQNGFSCRRLCLIPQSSPAPNRKKIRQRLTRPAVARC